MCFNWKVSLGTLIFTWSSALYLLSKKLTKSQQNNIYFLMIFSSIQLADTILWLNNMKQNMVNYLVTSFLIPMILSAQVLFNLYVRNNFYNILLNIFVIFYIIILFNQFNGYSTNVCNNYFSSPLWSAYNSSGKPKKSPEITLGNLILFAFLIFYPNCNKLVFWIGIFFPLMHYFISAGYGSFWCFAANIMAVWYLIKY